MATTYNPNYVPSGPNNRENPYYEKYNHVKIPRAWETREKFLAVAPLAPELVTVAEASVTTFDRGGVNYTQILWTSAGLFAATGPIAGVQYALGAGGGSGGALSNAGGGGGAGAVVQGVTTLEAGLHTVTIGAGGAGVINATGNAGSNGIVAGPSLNVTAAGGGNGGSTQNGGNGGCGGGGGTNGTSRLGGTGSVGGKGGASVAGAATAERAAGGGGGMGGNGADAVVNVGGAGGVGITLAWTEPPMDVAGGGGATANSGVHGSASHGGTAGSREGPSLNATLSGGSGGSGGAGGYSSGAGGNGFFVMVFPSANARVNIPTLTVTGGTITPFTREGVNYTQIEFSASGSFTLSGDLDWHNRALGAGGGTGGRSASIVYLPGGGGAGGLLVTLSGSLAAGTYAVTIGAGGAAITSGSARNDGSNSVLSLPGGGSETAVGGGGGGLYGTGMTTGVDGGSGGGGRGWNSNDTGTGAAGAGVPGQGYAGGLGRNRISDAERSAGGGGGAGGAGGDGGIGVAGTAGAGVLLDWIASPVTVCSGGAGVLSANTDASPGATFGSGSRGSVSADVGKGGDGFLFLVVRSDQVKVEMAV